MEHEERIYDLMMDALDNNLDERGTAELTAYLDKYPDLATEWEAMQWVDDLLITTPPIEAPQLLVEHTLARLPNPRLRRLFAVVGFGLALLAGMITVGAVLAVSSIDVGSIIGSSLNEFVLFIRVFSVAILATIGTTLRDQPQLWLYLAIMLAVLAVWQMAYSQLLSNRPQPIPVSARNE